jgi:UDP-N-acetylmuramate dehydrogenase
VSGLSGDLVAALGDRLEQDRPIGPLTTYRVGGPARWFATVDDANDLVAVARALAAGPDVPVLVVGRGSNLLVCDAGFDGLVVQLGAGFASIEVLGAAAGGGTVVRAGGAASLPVVARRTVAEGLTGFEWAVGVPGSVGGAVRMNAGGHGADMAASLVRVRVVDLRTGEDERVAAADLDLTYRHSSVRDDQVVVDADLRLDAGDPGAGEAEMSEIVRWRREHQPGGQNAGSVFTNPDGDSAGRLVDAAGCRGLRLGTAEVSTKHANFIQADPGGSADDVFALMVQVARRVQGAVGVRLRPETRLVGFPPFADAVAGS